MYQRRAGGLIQTAGSSNQASIKAPTWSISTAIDHPDQNKGSGPADPAHSRAKLRGSKALEEPRGGHWASSGSTGISWGVGYVDTGREGGESQSGPQILKEASKWQLLEKGRGWEWWFRVLLVLKTLGKFCAKEGRPLGGGKLEPPSQPQHGAGSGPVFVDDEQQNGAIL
ncbi:hypothetical protein BTVI_122954 [Pitangus sulphuratus]|nr:hypothetical protein BTVI_122954 [Pitangus sulphuratus]